MAPLKVKKKLFRLSGSWYSFQPARTHDFNTKICQNMSKFGHFAQKANFWHLFAGISGLTASFFNPIDALKP